MIRRFVLGLALSLALSAPALAEDLKIAVASMARVSAQSQPGQAVDKLLQDSFGKERDDLEKMSADFQAKVADFEKQASVLSDSARKERETALNKQAEELNAKSNSYGMRLNQVQQAITRQMEEVLTTACNDYGRRNNLALIIDEAALLYATNAVDVSDKLIEEVNRVWEARGGKYELPAAE